MSHLPPTSITSFLHANLLPVVMVTVVASVFLFYFEKGVSLSSPGWP